MDKRPNKGKHNGECNRAACRAHGLVVCMWSFTEHAYYCVPCSKEIERWSSLVGVKPMERRDSQTDRSAE
jgi:hypothetical protein